MGSVLLFDCWWLIKHRSITMTRQYNPKYLLSYTEKCQTQVFICDHFAIISTLLQVPLHQKPKPAGFSEAPVSLQLSKRP